LVETLNPLGLLGLSFSAAAETTAEKENLPCFPSPPKPQLRTGHHPSSPTCTDGAGGALVTKGGSGLGHRILYDFRFRRTSSDLPVRTGRPG
jgi:hypothetical protein